MLGSTQPVPNGSVIVPADRAPPTMLHPSLVPVVGLTKFSKQAVPASSRYGRLMNGSLDEPWKPQLLRVPVHADPTKPGGQVPDWVATTICASARSVMLLAWTNASASAPSWSRLGLLGGGLMSLKTFTNTVPENADAPVLSAYGEVIVDQLSCGDTPSPL